MKDHKMKWRVLAACGLLVLLALSWSLSYRSTVDCTKVPLDRSQYLADISEPITMVQGLSWDDGGSMGLLFRDSKQVEKAVCLVNDLDENKDLVLGSMFPSQDKRVPVGGDEERAFLGLLQRWCRQDPEAREWLSRMESRSRPGKDGSIFRGDESEQQLVKGRAVSMMRKLQKRN
jgi:hypothetical protein